MDRKDKKRRINEISDEEVIEILKESDISQKWIKKNYRRLQKKFPNKYIAVQDRSVIVSSKKLDGLLKSKELKGKDLNRTVLEFIPEKDIEMLL